MKREFKKGMWYSSAPGNSVLEKFKAVKAAGFDGIEPPSELDVEEVLRARDETGLAIPSVSCGKCSRSMTSAHAGEREEAVQGIAQALRAAKRYGASSILVVAGGVTDSVSYAQAWQRSVESLRTVVSLAEQLGVAIAIENVWNQFLLSPLEAARFVDEFKSRQVGWQFDVGNVVYLGWPEQWIRTLGKRIQKVHVKEFSRKHMNEKGMRAGFAVEFLEGDNDWPAVMKALDEVGYQGWAIVEPAWQPKGVDGQARLKVIAERLDKILAS